MPIAPESAPAIVCNSGPLIALAGIGQLALLEGLYGRVLISPTVHLELTGSQRFRSESRLFDVAWLHILPLAVPPDPLVVAELDRGEAEMLALALQTNAQRVLIDERKGRRIASLVYHLPVIGTGGILLSAKRAGLAQKVRPLMEAMQQNGYFLSRQLVEGICQAAGE